MCLREDAIRLTLYSYSVYQNVRGFGNILAQTNQIWRYTLEAEQYSDIIRESLWLIISAYKVKVKCTFVQALRLCTSRTAYRGIRGIALLFHDHGTWRGWGVSVTPRPLFTPGKDPVPIVHEAEWTPGPVWTGGENLAPHRDSIPGPPSP
jgi:hypothetical protein